MRLMVLFLLFFSSAMAQAGYYELGLSGNYRKIYLPTSTGEARESFDETVSYSASIAYYFAEMAALELSYTRGQSERFVPSETADSLTTYFFSLVGMDLIFTFAKRQDPFVPYIKIGGAYFVEKYVDYEFTNHVGTSPAPQRVKLDPTFVPSLGLGLKLRLTDTMAFKIGAEAWTSDALGRTTRWDWAGRAGVSWFF
ncbi:MAG: hypothetical protein KDD33_06960 [Bdellovibrionales bacterium]|nr:hypothetical protein [Bdellovibrionales bacterium]